jgi:hypothetical protein
MQLQEQKLLTAKDAKKRRGRKENQEKKNQEQNAQHETSIVRRTSSNAEFHLANKKGPGYSWGLAT